MSDEEPKSAYEIAMQKLRERDKSEGREEEKPLSGSQRDEIARIRKEAEAKLAQLEIMLRSHLRDGRERPDFHEERARLEENYQRDRQRIEEDTRSKVAVVKRGA
jgi:hypothetical protein